MKIAIRKFNENDIINKVKWINDCNNNKFLHYDLPLEENKTRIWYNNNINRTDRYDATIEVNDIPVGLIGLLNIDFQNKKAEYYITIGNRNYLGKGVATKASNLLLEYAFNKLHLKSVYLYTEVANISAVRLYEKLGFVKEGLIHNDLYINNKFIDRYIYVINRTIFLCNENSLIYKVSSLDNHIYFKREDLIPFSFGGNKARKAKLFFNDIQSGNYDCVVTYGTSSSNHCRIVSNMAAARKLKCYIISPKEKSDLTNNSILMKMFGAEIIVSQLDKVHDTIENLLQDLKNEGKNPYFIPGGGHGNIGTQAYVQCYEEIKQYEIENKIKFDYIFLASGTGTTQAGLIVGKIVNNDDVKIIGISIARKNPYGRNVVMQSVKDYLTDIENLEAEKNTVFLDDYIFEGYGATNIEIENTIKDTMINYGIPLDTTYTGKAFYGMNKYIKDNGIENKNILFIHTGGTPLFFDNIKKN